MKTLTINSLVYNYLIERVITSDLESIVIGHDDFIIDSFNYGIGGYFNTYSIALYNDEQYRKPTIFKFKY